MLINKTISLTEINSSPFDAWKSAFRECCKLSALTPYLDLDDEDILESKERLKIWLEPREGENNEFVKMGADMGLKYAEENNERLEKIRLVNDYDFLVNLFNQSV